MNTQHQKKEYEDVSIGTEEGLRSFLHNVQHLYEKGQEKEVELSGSPELVAYSDALHGLYQSLHVFTNELISTIKSGRKVSHHDAKKLQSDYNSLVTLIQKPVSIPKPKPEVTHSNVEVALPVEEQHSKQEPVSRAKPESLPEHENQVTLKSSDQSHQKEYVEEVSIKPRTGSLKVSSEDVETVDINDRVTAVQSDEGEQPKHKKKKKRKRKKKKHPEHKLDALRTQLAALTSDVEQIKNEYPHPNQMQTMLFEEVSESLVYLQSVLKDSDITDQVLETVREVESHVRHALTAIVEADDIEVLPPPNKTDVLVVTEQVQEIEESQEEVVSPVSFVPVSITTNDTSPSRTRPPRPKQLQTLPKPNSIHEPESLTEKYLSYPKAHAFITEHYSSLKGFERILDATITKIESETIDQIEKWLGDLPASAFAYIKDMKTSEVIAFSDRPFHEVQADLKQQNIKYETFATWRDALDEMMQLVPKGEHMLFGELYANWMLVLAMQEPE